MKRKIVVIILALIMCCPSTGSKSIGSSPPQDIYRLHIIANSNSEKDQSVKLEIRDRLLIYEAALLSKNKSVTSAQDTKELLCANANDIYSIAIDILRKNNLNYSVKLSTGIYPFPNRTYGSKLYPAGDYNALRVVLGDGKGENWWCVMFPPLCIINEDVGKSEHKEAENSSSTDVEFKSIFSSIGRWFRSLWH